MSLKHTSNRNGELHHMLQVTKLFCNRDLVGYSHSNGKMKSARLQPFFFFFGPGLISRSQCCYKERENNVVERENILLPLENRKVIN